MNAAMLLVLGGAAAVLAASAGRRRTDDGAGREGSTGNGGDRTRLQVTVSEAKNWSTTIESRGPSAADACIAAGVFGVEDVARCTAEQLFPEHEWPATTTSPYWQRRAWNLIVVTARQALGMGPPQL